MMMVKDEELRHRLMSLCGPVLGHLMMTRMMMISLAQDLAASGFSSAYLLQNHQMRNRRSSLGQTADFFHYPGHFHYHQILRKKKLLKTENEIIVIMEKVCFLEKI